MAAATLHHHVLVLLQHHIRLVDEVQHRDGTQFRWGTAWLRHLKDKNTQYNQYSNKYLFKIQIAVIFCFSVILHQNSPTHLQWMQQMHQRLYYGMIRGIHV